MNKKAFTIIELLIYIAISTVILFAIVDFVISIDQLKKRGSIISEVENQGLNMINIITQKTRDAESIIGPIVSNSGPDLSLAMPSPKNPVSFNLINASLQMIDENNNTEPINNELVVISNLVFTNLSTPSSPGSIKIELTIKYNNQSSKSVYDYEKTFYATASLR